MSHYKKIYSIKLCIPHYFSNRNLLFVFFLVPNIHLIYVLVKSTVELEPSLSTAGDIPVNKNIEQLPSNVSPSAAAIKPPVPARNPSSSAPIAPSRVAPAIPPRPSSSNIPTDSSTECNNDTLNMLPIFCIFFFLIFFLIQILPLLKRGGMNISRTLCRPNGRETRQKLYNTFV